MPLTDPARLSGACYLVAATGDRDSLTAPRPARVAGKRDRRASVRDGVSRLAGGPMRAPGARPANLVCSSYTRFRSRSILQHREALVRARSRIASNSSAANSRSSSSAAARCGTSAGGPESGSGHRGRNRANRSSRTRRSLRETLGGGFVIADELRIELVQAALARATFRRRPNRPRSPQPPADSEISARRRNWSRLAHREVEDAHRPRRRPHKADILGRRGRPRIAVSRTSRTIRTTARPGGWRARQRSGEAVAATSWVLLSATTWGSARCRSFGCRLERASRTTSRSANDRESSGLPTNSVRGQTTAP